MRMQKRIEVVFLVLGGGGFTTAWQVGCLVRLLLFCKNHGITVIGIFGTSGGAINAAVLTQAQTQEELFPLGKHLKRVWLALCEAGPYEVIPLRFWNIGFWERVILGDSSGILGLLEGTVPRTRAHDKTGGVDFGKVISSPIIFECSALYEGSSEVISFSNRTRRTTLAHPRELLLGCASSATIPTIFDPVEIGGAHFSDVGWISFDTALENRPDLIIALLPYLENEAVSTGVTGTSWISDWISSRWSFRSLYHRSATIAAHNKREISVARKAGIPIETLYMSSSVPGLVTHKFRPGDLRTAIRQGDHDVAAFLARLKNQYRFKS